MKQIKKYDSWEAWEVLGFRVKDAGTDGHQVLL
jgi:hypothetical protein